LNHIFLQKKTMLSFPTTIAILIVLCLLEATAADTQKAPRKHDPNDNKGLTPFFLQDPNDQMCLSPWGFTMCDENALWILTKRAGKTTYSLVSLLAPSESICLQAQNGFLGIFSSDKLTLGPCSKKSAQTWDWVFIDQNHVRLSNRGQCLVRGKKGAKNSISLQSCKNNDFVPLLYHPTAVHERGFYLKSADSECFDGNKFRSCEGTGANRLLWGVGVKYVWGEAKRYIFNFFHQERSNCIVAQRNGTVEKAPCSSAGAVSWGLQHGKLSQSNGKKCVARKADDSAFVANCNDIYEYISLEVPSSYSNEQLESMLQSKVS